MIWVLMYVIGMNYVIILYSEIQLCLKCSYFADVNTLLCN